MDLPPMTQVTGKGRDKRPVHCRALYRLARSSRIGICWTQMKMTLRRALESFCGPKWPMATKALLLQVSAA